MLCHAVSARRVSLVLFTAAFACISLPRARAADIQEQRWRDAQAEIRGTLFLVGGGALPKELRERFVQLAGGSEARLVIIPSASARAPEAAEKEWEAWPLKSVKMLHTTDRRQADDPEFVRPLTEATAVWIGGGDQSRVTAAYRGTAVERELQNLLRRGGVIGGTSAGAAVMSPTMIVGGKTEARLQPGLGLLPGFIVDQHFQQRQRLPRLLHAVKITSGTVGLGIDEETAAIVRQRRLTVLGAGNVTVVLQEGESKPSRIETLKAGGMADLIAMRRSALFRSFVPFPPKQPGPPRLKKGSLIIGGGGRMPLEAVRRFVALAGGPDAQIIYIPTALEDPLPQVLGEVRLLQRAGARNVKVWHTRSRDEANQPDFVAPLKSATGIWFSGGRQWRFVDAYERTLAERCFHEVLSRGGVIGGSSAGASIQSDYMPRGDPLGNRNIIAEGYERGFGFLQGTAVDQHFFARNRQADMAELIRTYPQFLGIGIDEGTVLIVQGSIMEILGASKAALYDAGKPPQAGEFEPIILTSGMRYDMVRRRPLPAK